MKNVYDIVFQDVGTVRTKDVPEFSARQLVSETKGHLPTLSERLDTAEKSENGFGRIVDTPKRVSFGVGGDGDTAKGNAASKWVDERRFF